MTFKKTRGAAFVVFLACGLLASIAFGVGAFLLVAVGGTASFMAGWLDAMAAMDRRMRQHIASSHEPPQPPVDPFVPFR